MQKSMKKNQTKVRKQAGKSASKQKYIYRCSITGHIVNKSYAKANPDTTQRETK